MKRQERFGEALFGLLSGFLLQKGGAAKFNVLTWTVETWGNKGKLMLPELFHIRRAPFIAGVAMFFILLLELLQKVSSR